MKLLFITSLKEYQKSVAEILSKSGIPVFSVTETIGFKDQQKSNMLDHWFSSGTDQFDSIFVFSFTEDTRAQVALESVKQHNALHNTGFPIRAFVVPVEASSY